MHRLSCNLVKYQYLAQFPVNHLSHSVEPALALFLCQFAVFTYHVINCPISVITKFTLAIINFSLDIFGPYDIIFSYFKKRFSFEFPLLHHTQVISRAISQFVTWSIYTVFFFPIWFLNFGIIIFSVLFLVSYNPSAGLYTRLCVAGGSDYMPSMYLWICLSFWSIFFRHIDSTL